MLRSCWVVAGVLMVGVCASSVVAQPALVRGFVTERASGEAVEGVNIIFQDGVGAVWGTTTDIDGFFVRSGLSPGRYILQASYVGFETFRDTLDLGAGVVLTLNFSLEEDPGMCQQF